MQFYKKYSLKRHNIKYVCIKLYTLIQYMNELHTKHFVKVVFCEQLCYTNYVGATVFLYCLLPLQSYLIINK